MNINVEAPVFSRRRVAVFLIVVAAVISAMGFVADLHNTLAYPGSDFRNRVVGARLMLEGIDPYLFKWQPGVSERFFDPLDDPTELVSKLSVPPTVLTLHGAIAGLSYVQQKIIWLLVQWGALAGTVWIFLKTSGGRGRTPLMLAVSFCFANSLFWRFHVSSGQIYVIYTFVLAIVWFALHSKLKYKNAVGGFAAGVLASLRPSFVLFFIPFALKQQYSFLAGGVAGFISSVAFSYWVVGHFVWKRYILTILQMTGLLDLATYLPSSDRIPLASNIDYPTIVEGFDWSVTYPLEPHFADTSLYLLLNVLRVPNERGILIFALLATIVFLSIYFLKYVSKENSIGYVALFGTLMCLLGDFFIPIPRFPYYDIQMLLPLLMIISLADPRFLTSYKGSVVLVAGLVLSMVGFFVVPRSLFFAGFLIALYVVVLSLVILRRQHRLGLPLSADLSR